jgi:hypothetical protein
VGKEKFKYKPASISPCFTGSAIWKVPKKHPLKAKIKIGISLIAKNFKVKMC